MDGAFCTTLDWMGRELAEVRPSDETTRLTTKPLPVEGATGGLGACRLPEDNDLKPDVETGLL